MVDGHGRHRTVGLNSESIAKAQEISRIKSRADGWDEHMVMHACPRLPRLVRGCFGLVWNTCLHYAPEMQSDRSILTNENFGNPGEEETWNLLYTTRTKFTLRL